ncbi:MAG: hypothetical protein ACI93R_002672 [Flavobacteriales bacterium]|jgi:hypothetical protein
MKTFFAPSFLYYVFIIGFLVLTGCSVSERHLVEDSEGLVSKNFFRSVKPNKTNISWVESNLGESYEIQDGRDGFKYYSYKFTRAKHRSAHLLMVMRVSGREEHQEFYHLLVCDGLIRKHWWDKFEMVQDHKFKRVSCHSRKGRKSNGTLSSAQENLEQKPDLTVGGSEMADAENKSEAVPKTEEEARKLMGF